MFDAIQVTATEHPLSPMGERAPGEFCGSYIVQLPGSEESRSDCLVALWHAVSLWMTVEQEEDTGANSIHM
jgi:hypothetical protein